MEKFKELIESYNSGSRNIEELLEELVKLSRTLSEEQQRHVRLICFCGSYGSKRGSPIGFG